LLNGLRADKTQKPDAATAEKSLASEKSRLARTSGKNSGDPRQAKAVSVVEAGIAKEKSPAKFVVDEVARQPAAAAPAATALKEEPSGSKKSDRRRAEDRDVASTGGMSGADASGLSAAKTVAEALLRTPATAHKTEKSGIEAVEEEPRPGSTKQKDKRSGTLQLNVYDQRSRPAAADGAIRPQQSGKDAPSGGGNETDLVIRLRSGDGGSMLDKSADATANKPGASFQELLSRELRENANADIVKQASLVLKDGGKGLIRLSLQPESLGSVKIRLEMTENKIAGHIVVESDAAFKAFERELRSLEQAFLDGGFDGASLDVSVSADSGRDGAPGHRQAEVPMPFFSERTVASSYDVPADALGKTDPATGMASTAINMLA